MSETPELSRPVPLDRLGRGGSTIEITAEPAELKAIAARLLLPDVLSMSCRFVLARSPGDPAIILAQGELAATIVQMCVVTLEPFESAVHEAFRVRFVPSGQESEDDEPDSDDELPYEGTALDLGEAAVEQLALSLDPFPRSPGAVLPETAEEEARNPFAALAARRKPDG